MLLEKVLVLDIVYSASVKDHEFKRTEHICTITKLRMKWARIYWNELEELEHNQGNFYSTVLDSDGKIRLEVSKRIDEVKTK